MAAALSAARQLAHIVDETERRVSCKRTVAAQQLCARVAEQRAELSRIAAKRQEAELALTAAVAAIRGRLEADLHPEVFTEIVHLLVAFNHKIDSQYLLLRSRLDALDARLTSVFPLALFAVRGAVGRLRALRSLNDSTLSPLHERLSDRLHRRGTVEVLASQMVLNATWDRAVDATGDNGGNWPLGWRTPLLPLRERCRQHLAGVGDLGPSDSYALPTRLSLADPDLDFNLHVAVKECLALQIREVVKALFLFDPSVFAAYEGQSCSAAESDGAAIGATTATLQTILSTVEEALSPSGGAPDGRLSTLTPLLEEQSSTELLLPADALLQAYIQHVVSCIVPPERVALTLGLLASRDVDGAAPLTAAAPSQDAHLHALLAQKTEAVLVHAVQLREAMMRRMATTTST